MQKIQIAGRLIALLFLISMLWLVYLILSLVLEEHPNENHEHIPNTSIEVFIIDGNSLVKTFISAAIFHRDTDLESLLREIVPEDGKGTVKPVGIAFDSDIIHFKMVDKSDTLSGWLFNLNNSRLFLKNLPEYLNKETVLAANQSVGVIIKKPNDGRNNYRALANRIVKNKTHFADENLSSAKGLATYWHSMGEKKSSLYSVAIEGDKVLFSGELNWGKIEPHAFSLKPAGFHLETSLLASPLTEQIESFFQGLEIELPELEALSINYFGAQIASDADFKVLPNANMQFIFKDKIVLDSLFKAHEVLESETSDYQILQLYDQRYSIRATGSMLEMYAQSPGKLETQQKHFAAISGNPKNLLKIKGNDLISSLMNLSPLVGTSHQLTGSISSLDLQVVEAKNGTYALNGTIQMKKNEQAIHALTKFLLRSDLF